MKLVRPLDFIARKLLYLWIRTEVLPADTALLKIEPDTPVVYVLDSRAWSSLLVLEQECRKLGLISPLARITAPELRNWHCVYTVLPRQPFKAWLQQQPKRSRMLRGILEVLQENPELDVQFVPVTIFWGRPVAKQQHALTVLFAHSWNLAGRIRKFLTILLHGRSTLVQFSEVIRFRDVINVHLSNDENIDNIQHRLADRQNEIKTATLGPDTSHRRTLVRELLMTPRVQQAIHSRCEEDNISPYQASLQARRYLYEIVADRTSITIRVLQSLLTWFWNRFYSGIEVNHSNMLRKLARSHELVYVPCHRSHVDYLLLSYVIHFEGLSIPHIAAGKNLNMPIIGPILRGGGAFFIRRSFSGNELYSAVLFEYLARLVAMGSPVEYFIEGGRSRTGRLLKPKSGLLAMTVRGFLQYRSRPVAFIPVYIGYEKMIEGKSYLAELSGLDKKAESLLSSVRSIFNIRGNHGRVFANFGQPVFLTKLLDHHHPNWPIQEYDDNQRPTWLMDVVKDLSQQIMTRINQATSVNAINLVSTVLLATPKQHMDESQLVEMVELYASMVRSLAYSDKVTVTEVSGAEQVQRAERLRHIRRRKHKLGDIIYLNSHNAVLLTYYRNNILHLMALPSIIACAFMNSRAISRERVVKLVSLVYPFLQSELFIEWTQQQLPETIGHVIDNLVEHKLLINMPDGRLHKPRPSGIEFAHLEQLSKVISPVLELYYMTFAILLNHGPNRISQTALVEQSHLIAQRVSMIYELNSPDFFDIRLITNFLHRLTQLDYLSVDDDGLLAYNSKMLEEGEDAVSLLNSNIRSSILQLLKSNPPGTHQ
jgi:glycerol-3-phosphate O-acyltransferase